MARYNPPSPVRLPPPAPFVSLTDKEELTLVSWRLERGRDEYALNWRDLARLNGVKDPMQVAGEDRAVLGVRLSIGQKIEY